MMLYLNPTLMMILFCTSLVFTYIAVRAGWVHMGSGFVVGSMVNSLFFFLYALSRGNGLSQAIAASLVMGFIFSAGASVLGAVFARKAASILAVVPQPEAADSVMAEGVSKA